MFAASEIIQLFNRHFLLQTDLKKHSKETPKTQFQPPASPVWKWSRWTFHRVFNYTIFPLKHLLYVLLFDSARQELSRSKPFCVELHTNVRLLFCHWKCFSTKALLEYSPPYFLISMYKKCCKKTCAKRGGHYKQRIVCKVNISYSGTLKQTLPGETIRPISSLRLTGWSFNSQSKISPIRRLQGSIN